MIEVNNLTKCYGDLVAIESVSFKVGKGEILGFLGPNGAGKTTTMRILTCYMPATSGTASVEGFDIFQDSMEVRRRVGYLPEHPPLYNEMTVDGYIKFVSKIKGVPRSERRARIDEVIEKCALGDVKHRVIGHLSKGFKQRVGLAQALIHNPEVLILDEPTIGLDPRQIIEIRNLIKALAGDHTVVLSTHILSEVKHICQKVLIINQGRIAAEDSLDRFADDRALEQFFMEIITGSEPERDEEAPEGPLND